MAGQGPITSNSGVVINGSNTVYSSRLEPVLTTGQLITITPLRTAQQALLIPNQPEVRIIKKLLVKATSKGTTSKKDNKIFTQRNINPEVIVSLENLRHLIKEQLKKDVTGTSWCI